MWNHHRPMVNTSHELRYRYSLCQTMTLLYLFFVHISMVNHEKCYGLTKFSQTIQEMLDLGPNLFSLNTAWIVCILKTNKTGVYSYLLSTCFSISIYIIKMVSYHFRQLRSESWLQFLRLHRRIIGMIKGKELLY